MSVDYFSLNSDELISEILSLTSGISQKSISKEECINKLGCLKGIQNKLANRRGNLELFNLYMTAIMFLKKSLVGKIINDNDPEYQKLPPFLKNTNPLEFSIEPTAVISRSTKKSSFLFEVFLETLKVKGEKNILKVFEVPNPELGKKYISNIQNDYKRDQKNTLSLRETFLPCVIWVYPNNTLAFSAPMAFLHEQHVNGYKNVYKLYLETGLFLNFENGIFESHNNFNDIDQYISCVFEKISVLIARNFGGVYIKNKNILFINKIPNLSDYSPKIECNTSHLYVECTNIIS